MIDTFEIDDYLKNLTRNYQSIQKIWLFGSRLDENTYWKTSPPKDWDLIVFTNRETMEKMKNDKSLKHDNIDLIVVYDNSMHYVRLRRDKDDRERSWGHFEWQEENGTKATYRTEDFKGTQRCSARVIWSRSE